MQNDNFLSNYYVFELKQSAETPTLSLTGKSRHIGFYFELGRYFVNIAGYYISIGLTSLFIHNKHGYKEGRT